jgi:flagellar hook-basal body complex protein FliE
VTFALEQARLSLELMLQVRSRLVEGYQQIMGMQL